MINYIILNEDGVCKFCGTESNRSNNDYYCNQSEMYDEECRKNYETHETLQSELTRTTSGIEPEYILYYVRRKKINP